jgi:hypothetical protein
MARPPEIKLATLKWFMDLFVSNPDNILKANTILNFDDINKLVQGQKIKQCDVCFIKSTQKRGKKHDCWGRDFHGYKHLRINNVFICLICLKGCITFVEINLHYLEHNFFDVKMIGLHPKILRKAFLYKTDRKLKGVIETVVVENTKGDNLIISRDDFRLQLGRMVEAGQMQPSGLRLEDLTYPATHANDLEDIYNYSLWDNGEGSLTPHEVQLLRMNSLHHALLKPVLPPKKTLLRHTIGHSDFDIFVGTFNNHVVVTYSQKALRFIKGGLSQLFDSLQILRELANKYDEWKPYKPVQIINSYIGLEIVLSCRCSFEPFLYNLVHGESNMGGIAMKKFVLEQCLQVNKLIPSLTESLIGCMDISRPSLWYSTNQPCEEDTYWIFAGLHTFYRIEEHDRLFSVIVTNGNFISQRIQPVMLAEQQLVAIVPIIMYMIDCHSRCVEGLRD